MYYDWFGTKESLEEWKADWENACKKAGIKSCKHYTSHQARYHYAYIMKMDAYDDVMKAMGHMTIERDRNVATHTVLEIFSES